MVLTCIGKWGLCVALNISLSELKHIAIDLLCLPGKTEGLQEHAESINKRNVTEVDQVNKGMHGRNVDFVTGGYQRCILKIVAETYASPRYSPIIALLNPSVLSKNFATSWGSLLEIKPVSTRNCMPFYRI
jgi:hypothetical protein